MQIIPQAIIMMIHLTWHNSPNIEVEHVAANK